MKKVYALTKGGVQIQSPFFISWFSGQLINFEARSQFTHSTSHGMLCTRVQDLNFNIVSSWVLFILVKTKKFCGKLILFFFIVKSFFKHIIYGMYSSNIHNHVSENKKWRRKGAQKRKRGK